MIRGSRQGRKNDMLDNLIADRADQIHGTVHSLLRRNQINLFQLLIRHLPGIMLAGKRKKRQKKEKGQDQTKTVFLHGGTPHMEIGSFYSVFIVSVYRGDENPQMLWRKGSGCHDHGDCAIMH